MNWTKREKYMLFQALEKDVYRYLMSNTYGREDGCEKANRHMLISSTIVSFILCEKYDERIHDEIMFIVHDYLGEILTDRMDEVIGFPVFSNRPDYESLVVKFIDVIMNNLNKIEELINQAIKEKR